MPRPFPFPDGSREKRPSTSFSFHLCLFASIGFLAGFALLDRPARAQTPESRTIPYAVLDRNAVSYHGPSRSAETDVMKDTAAIGLILPLRGREQREGTALLAAAEMALEEEQQKGPLADGRQLVLAVHDESGPWGQASSEIMRAVEEDHALALLTSANGVTAHQAEQIANKIGVPILTLSSDPTTTEANLPWLFRLGPSDRDQAAALCQRLYVELKLRRVLVVYEEDHDGRTGKDEFQRAVRIAMAPPPYLAAVASGTEPAAQVVDLVRERNPEAVVFWTGAALSGAAIARLRASGVTTSLYLCRKAAQLGVEMGTESPVTANNERDENIYFVGLAAAVTAPSQAFEKGFWARTGTPPGFAAREMYEAVHLVAGAIRASGMNRVHLRNYLAGEREFSGRGEGYAFDAAGNRLGSLEVRRVRTMPDGTEKAPAPRSE